MDLVCFSHLNWNFVYQRPQHLLSRFALEYRVFYIQEFSYTDNEDGFALVLSDENVCIVLPNLNKANPDQPLQRQAKIIEDIFIAQNITEYILWYYTPLAVLFSQHLKPVLTIYDCMDELSAFKFADPLLKHAENILFEKAEIVFTGGNSLYEAKKHHHKNVQLFPSSIDKSHFNIARYKLEEYQDQVNIAHPRLGFFGVIDERFDIELIEQVASLKPEWNFILIGPVVKIDPAILPRYANIHYLGSKTYNELPGYLSGWDIALIPFAINESTRFISPTKTPEYLAAGKPVISTPITDVMNPYGNNELVHIVHTAAEFIDKAVIELNTNDKSAWLASVDSFLDNNSWDITWKAMHGMIIKILESKQHLRNQKKEVYV